MKAQKHVPTSEKKVTPTQITLQKHFSLRHALKESETFEKLAVICIEVTTNKT